MRENDLLILGCLEDIHYCLEESLKKIDKVRSVHAIQIGEWVEELSSQRRIIEEISFPARLIVEHMTKMKYKSGQVALETSQLSQSFSSISRIKVEQFGMIKIKLGELEVGWRDEGYTYYLYPDKVELRAIDEKSALKLFFSLSFSQQMVERFPEIICSPNVSYIHPQLQQWLE